MDLPRALTALRKGFGIRTLLLEGGGHINGAFFAAGLVDKLSLLVVPAVDGRVGVATTIDGLAPRGWKPARLALKSVERRRGGTIWVRYDVA